MLLTVEKYSPGLATSVEVCKPIGKQESQVQKHLLLLNVAVASSSDAVFASGKILKAAKLATLRTLLWYSWFRDYP